MTGAPAGPWSEEDARWMRQALEEASGAGHLAEVPVGALVVHGDRCIGRGANATEVEQDPTAHAEMLAIRQAARFLGSRRLLGTVLYVTLEPCAMCAGAIVLARIPRLVFGAHDPRSGACGSLRNLVQDPRLNHRCQVSGGVLAEECGAQLRSFFAGLRTPGRPQE
ncbi:MAG: tRNA adenosine(34) deaminase TadA [Candidatus Latescibacterota bacterium]